MQKAVGLDITHIVSVYYIQVSFHRAHVDRVGIDNQAREVRL